MEALSGVASGIAVVSLSIQLIDCVGTIKTFIRNVKDAQKELERLVDLLERLEALLQDIRALMEQQTSLAAQHFPKPSATIFKCLKSCEKTLEPLQMTVDKYMPAKSKTSTSMDRLKNGLRIGFKTKEIEDFETRIEREINFLHASLGANCGAILIQLGPALLGTQSNHAIVPQSSTTISKLNTETVIISSRDDDTMLSNAKAMRPSSSVIRVRSPLERLGIYQRKIIRRMPCSSGEVTSGKGQGDEAIVSIDHETTLLWSILGHGLTWIRSQSFGRVVPSLSTFPVISNFPTEIYDVLRYGEIQDFQNLLRDKVVHPFSHDAYGKSLLHLSAAYYRADIFLLLRSLGLEQSIDIHGKSPLKAALSGPKPPVSGPAAIYRCILEDPGLVDDFNPKHWYRTVPIWIDLGIYSYLYQESPNILPRGEYCVIRANVFWAASTDMAWALWEEKSNLSEYPCFKLETEILDIIKLQLGFLLNIFRLCFSTSDSFIIGAKLLEWMSNSDINVEQFLSQEVEIANASHQWDKPRRIFVFEPQEEGGWRLGFECAFDREASGYLLVSEYETIMVTGSWCGQWPIHEGVQVWEAGYHEWKTKRHVRFQRRMAAKARKQSGQKGRRSRMPGAWVH